MDKIINLKDYTNPLETALVGRDNGEALLQLFKDKKILFSELESSNSTITIVVPTNIVTINKSFFLGWLETRIKELGKERFNAIYKFETTQHILNKIQDHVDAALLTATQDEILGV